MHLSLKRYDDDRIGKHRELCRGRDANGGTPGRGEYEQSTGESREDAKQRWLIALQQFVNLVVPEVAHGPSAANLNRGRRAADPHFEADEQRSIYLAA